MSSPTLADAREGANCKSQRHGERGWLSPMIIDEEEVVAVALFESLKKMNVEMVSVFE